MIEVRYVVSAGTFLELSNGTRRFGDSPMADDFDDFEDAYVFYNSIDIEEEHRLMSQSNLFAGRSTYKRLERVEFFDDDTAEVDVIMFESYDGEDFNE